MPSPTMRTVLVLGASGLIAAVVGHELGALRSPAAPTSEATLPSEPAPRDDRLLELQRKLSSLQRIIAELRAKNPSEDYARLQQQLGALEARLDSLGESEGEPGSVKKPRLTDDEQRALERANTDVIIASLEDSFQAEPRNEAWATTIERSIGSTLQTEAGVLPKRVECQSKLCKVEMDHKDHAAEELFMHKLVHVRELGDTEAFLERHEHEDGSISTLTYLTGAGHHLPPAPVL